MRELDRNAMYFDRFGNPLKGRVNFYKKGTTERLTIFDTDGNALANPMFTSSGKLSPQVFLQDADYSIVWEQYIGQGTMATDDDSDNWAAAGSCVSLMTKVSLSIENSGIVNVATIADLRETDPDAVGNIGMLTLLGYDAAGDKPAVNYRWDGTSTDSDDGGDIVKYSGAAKGRWVMVAPESVDVRHFGVFPAETAEDCDSTQQMRLVTAHRYAVANDCKLVLNAVGDCRYYLLSTMNYSRLTIGGDGVRLVAASGTTATVNISLYGGNIYIYSDDEFCGTVYVFGKTVRSSFNANGGENVKLTASEEYVVDTTSDVHDIGSFTNIRVRFTSLAGMGYSFDSCEIESNNMLDGTKNNSFKNCDFTDKYFVGNSFMTATTTIEGCFVELSNFASAINWYNASVLNGATEFDFQGHVVDEDMDVANDGAIIRNGTFNGSLVFGRGVSSATMRECTISGITAPESLTLERCVVNCDLGSESYKITDLALDGCTVDGVIRAYNLDMQDSTASAVWTYTRNGVYEQTIAINRCVINGSCYMNGEPNASTTAIRGYILGTYIGGMIMQYSDAPYDAATSSFVYEGNYGGAPTNRVKKFNSQTAKHTTSESSWNGYTVNLDGMSLFGFGQKKLLVKVTATQGTPASSTTSTALDFHPTASMTKETIVDITLAGTYAIGSFGVFDFVTDIVSTPYFLIEAELL